MAETIPSTTTLLQLAGFEPLGMLSAAPSNPDLRRSLSDKTLVSLLPSGDGVAPSDVL